VKFFYAKVVDTLHVLVGPLRVTQRGELEKGGELVTVGRKNIERIA